MERKVSGPGLKPRVLFPSSPLEEAAGQSGLFTLGQTLATTDLHFLEIKISHSKLEIFRMLRKVV